MSRDFIDQDQYEENMKACARGDYDVLYWSTFASNAQAAGRMERVRLCGQRRVRPEDVQFFLG